jgi:hypothetical protein
MEAYERTANWPKSAGQYKVVQIELDGRDYLRFPTDEEQTEHAHILEAFLKAHGVEIEYSFTGKVSNNMLPAPSGERYFVHGMCRALVLPSQYKCRLDDYSGDYGISYDEMQIEKIKETEMEWRFSFA